MTIAGQGDIMESVQGSLLLASEKVLQDRPEVVQRFLKAYVKGIRDITDQGNEWDPKILDILSQWTGLPKEILAKLQTPYVDRNGKVDVKSIMDQYQFWKDNGIVKGSFDVRKSVDLSNLEKALMQMGN